MGRTFRLAAGLLLAGALMPVPIARATAPPIDIPTFRDSFLGADSVVVTRVGDIGLDGWSKPVPLGAVGPRLSLAPGARVHWSVRLARILAPEQGRFDARTCPGAPLNAPPAPRVDVAWAHGLARGHVALDFASECATIRMTGRSPVSIGFAGEAEALLGLCWEALPGDGPKSEVPVADGTTTIAPWPPPGEVLPKFGEYVYVQELPEAVARVAPAYPTVAREKGISGTVMVQALVGSDGGVHDTRVVKRIPLLDAAAEASVRQWRFKPARANGRPVSVWVAIPVQFTLH